MVRNVLSVVIVSGLTAIGSSASAHHSMAAYEQGDKVTIIEGMVTDVQWRNPHMLIAVAVPTGDGKTEKWSIEGGAVAGTIDAGITPKLLTVGACQEFCVWGIT